MKFVRDRVLGNAAERDLTAKFDEDLFRELHSLGYLQAFIPAELGGQGAPLIDLACISRELAYGSSGTATTFYANILGFTPVLYYAPELLRRRLAKEALSKLSLWSFCMTEPNTGTDIGNSEARARRVEGGYRLSGKKCFITNAGIASHLLVFARIDEEGSGKPRITAFYVPADSKGVTRGKALKKMGQRDSNTGELFFDDVFIPEGHRIGEEGQGLKIASRSIQRSRTLIAAAGVGASRRALDIARGYLQERKLYGGKPLLSLPPVENLLSQLHTEVEAAWMLTCMAAWAWENKENARKESSMAKLYSSDIAARVSSEVLELFGGYGCSQEYEIERIFRDTKLLELFEGSTFIQQTLIGKELFRAPGEQAERKPAEKKTRKAA